MWNQVIGGVRLQQQRAKAAECIAPNAMRVWYGDVCYPGTVLRRQPFGPGLDANVEGFVPRSGEPGSYYVSFNVRDHLPTVLAQMQYGLWDKGWIDAETVSLMAEFAVLNAEAGML